MKKLAFLNARNTILMQCTLVQAIIYDLWELSVMSSTNKLGKLVVTQLREICYQFYYVGTGKSHIRILFQNLWVPAVVHPQANLSGNRVM